MSKDDIEQAIHRRAAQIAKLLDNRSDVELRRDNKQGVKVIKVEKHEV